MEFFSPISGFILKYVVLRIGLQLAISRHIEFNTNLASVGAERTSLSFEKKTRVTRLRVNEKQMVFSQRQD